MHRTHESQRQRRASPVAFMTGERRLADAAGFNIGGCSLEEVPVQMRPQPAAPSGLETEPFRDATPLLGAHRFQNRILFGNGIFEWVERSAALLLLVAALPLLLVVAALVFALSRKSPLVAHCRVGQGGVRLWMLKLRTMWENCGPREWTPSLVEPIVDNGVPSPKASGDPRVTCRFAALLRKYSIDELPQLFHVARGEMSFVGPRPLTAGELAKYYEGAALEILQLRPGLTGLWQVMGRNRLGYKQRRRLDLFLTRHFSASLYLAILLRTPLRVLSGRDAW